LGLTIVVLDVHINKVKFCKLFILFHIHTVHLDIIKAFYSPTDAQVNCLRNNFKIYI